MEKISNPIIKLSKMLSKQELLNSIEETIDEAFNDKIKTSSAIQWPDYVNKIKSNIASNISQIIFTEMLSWVDYGDSKRILDKAIEVKAKIQDLLKVLISKNIGSLYSCYLLCV